MASVNQSLLQCFLYLTLTSLLFPIATRTSAFPTSLPDCPDKCGNITIPYPFGFDTHDGCYRDGFAITCNDSAFVPPKPFFNGTNIDLYSIDITTSEVIIPNYIGYDCYNETDNVYNNPSIGFNGNPFLFSYKRNKFTVIGCHALAYIDGGGEDFSNYTSGCASFCANLNQTTGDDGACDGLGCCQTAIPEGLSYYGLSWGFDNSTVWPFNPCSYAMLMQEDWYNFSMNDLAGYRLFYDEKIENSVPVVLDWAIRENGTCLSSHVESSISPACQSKLSRCENTTNGNGYICKCLQGYEGNPYIRNGCTDIDECKLLGEYPCFGTCYNTEGSYECDCPSGTTGIATIAGSCIEVPLISPVLARVLVGLGCGIATMLGMCFFVWAFRRYRRHVKEKELYEKYYKMMDNQLRVFSKKQIETATNNFDESYILGSGGRGKVYRGVFGDNHVVAIKMSREVEENHREEFVNEIVLLSQINHKNIVRVLGCCLEVKIPMLVYEFVPNGTLFELLHVQSSRPVPLAARLKIALESAEALDYLHSSISRPIIHGDVKSANILLDEGYCAKVSDFGASNIVPTDDTQVVELFQWTIGYLDPECLCSQMVTKSSDVYSFGVVMLELITRRKAIYRDETDQRKHLASEFVSTASNSEVHEMLDAKIITEDDKVIEVLKEMSELAIWCVSAIGEDRPTMKQVGEKLQFLVRIYGIIPFPEINPEESQSLLGGQTFYTASDTTTIPSSTGLCSTVLEIDTGSPR